MELDDHHIEIQCDNVQTIRLVTEEITKLQTKLRHVDVHNHWLRQEVSRGRINVTYTKSQDMIADGLTKVLPTETFLSFQQQMGLVDIRDKIKEQQDHEDKKDKKDQYQFLLED